MASSSNSPNSREPAADEPASREEFFSSAAPRRRFLRRAALIAGGSLAAWLAGCQPPGSSPSSTTGSRPPGPLTRRDRQIADTTSTQPTEPAEPPAPPPQRPEPPTTEPTLRVRIDRLRPDGRRFQSGGETVNVSAEHGWLRCRHVDRQHRGLTLRSPVRLDFDRRGFTITDADGYRPPVAPDQPLELASPADHAGELMWRGRRYPGSLVLHTVNQNRRRSADDVDDQPGVDVVNHVMLEDYLPGVLAGELYSHWAYDAFAAQAVAARTFACYEHLDRRSSHFDVTDTVASQVYLGGGAHRRAVEAARRTRGEVLLYDRRLVPAYYSSCCGGMPAHAVDTVSSSPVNDIRPLRGQGNCWSCSDAPVFRWQRTRSVENVRRHLARYGRDNDRDDLASIGRPQRIEAIAHNPFGRPRRYAVHDHRSRVVELDAESLRRALNVLDGRAVDADARLRSSAFAVEVRGDEARFTGQGFGHGVGLCQYGAQGMAASGQPYSTILNWYYPRARIARVY